MRASMEGALRNYFQKQFARSTINRSHKKFLTNDRMLNASSTDGREIRDYC